MHQGDVLAAGVDAVPDATWDDTLAALQHASSSSSADQTALAFSGALLLAASRPARAADVLSVVLERDPDNLEVRRLLAWALRADDQASRAVACLAAAFECRPDDPVLGRDLALALLDDKRWDQAARLTKRLGEKHPAKGEFFFLHGMACEEAGQLRHAANSFRACTRRWAGVAEAWLGLGRCLQRAGRAADAVAALTQALALAPQLIEANYYLGMAMIRLNEPAPARCHLGRFLEYSGWDQQRSEAQQWLARLGASGPRGPKRSFPVGGDC